MADKNKVIFQDAELNFLADSVISAKFMSVEDKRKFCGKIFSLADATNNLNSDKVSNPFIDIDYLENMLDNEENQKYKMENKNLINNERSDIVYTLSKLNNALKKYNIMFNYGYNTDIRVCPFAIVLDDGYYYLIGESSERIFSYRVDRIRKLRMYGEWDYCAKYEYRVDDTRYFEGGCYGNNGTSFSKGSRDNEGKKRCSNYINVVLKVRWGIISDLRDKFGNQINVCADGNGTEDWYTVQVRLLNTTPFLSWFVRFGADIKILSPDSLINDYKNYLNYILSNYN